jgi:hypothetical protein
MRVARHLFPLLGLLANILIIRAQDESVFDPVSPAREIEAMRLTDEEVRLDGLLDEPAWGRAPMQSNFFQVLPDQGQPLRQDVRVKILFDEKNLYIGAFCFDSLGRAGIRAPDMQRDFDFFNHDLFAVTFDPFGDRRNAMSFQTNPFGAQRDLLCFDDQFFDREWDGYWQVRTARVDSGWSAEMIIPWKTLRYTSDSSDWGVNFLRISRRLGEHAAWSPYPRAYTSYRMPYAGRIKGLSPPPPSINVQIRPYSLGTLDRFSNGDQTERVSTGYDLGGEVKWAITPQTVLDLTVNTDFAQADVDRQVQNLTRFSVFFPERRQFFLENASLFNIGREQQIQPFFSRRIGLSDEGLPLPIDAGLRLVSRAPEQNLGLLAVRQRATEDMPAANMAVARYSRNIGRQNRVGGLITWRNDGTHDNGGSPAQNNFTYSFDGFLRVNQSLFWSFMFGGSNNSGQRTDKGIAAVSRMRYHSNQWFLYLDQSLVTRLYDPGMGFLFGNDLIGTDLGGYRIMRPRWRPKNVRQIDPGFFFTMYHRASDGAFQQAEWSLFPLYVIFNTGERLYGYIIPTWQNLDAPFQPLGISIAPGRYRYTRYRLFYGSDNSKKWYYSFFAETGAYFDGRLTTLNPSVRWSPTPHLALSLDYTRNIIRALGIEETNKIAELITPQVRVAVNPRLQLSTFYQINTATGRDVWNVRLAWEFKPLSFLYLVYNSNVFDQGVDRLREEQIIGKATYLHQF